MANSPIGVSSLSMSRRSVSAMNRLACDWGGRGVRRPEMLRGIGAPRTPRLGTVEQIGRRRPRAVDRRAAQQADIGSGKGVGLAQGAQRDVMRRPLADAADRAQPRDRLVDRAERAEELRV